MPAPKIRYQTRLPLDARLDQARIVDGHGLELHNLEVQEGIKTFIDLATGTIEQRDCLVGAIYITEQGIRAEAEASGDEIPWRVEVDFPPGHFAELMKLPEFGPSEATWINASKEDQDYYDRLWERAFGGYVPTERLTMNVRDFWPLQKIGAGYFDPCTKALQLKAGFYGSLYSGEFGSPDLRVCPIHVSKDVTPGTVLVTREGKQATLTFLKE